MGLLYNCRVNILRRPNQNSVPLPIKYNVLAQYVAPSRDERLMAMSTQAAEINSEIKFDAGTDIKQEDVIQMIWLNGHRDLDQAVTFDVFLVARSANAIGLAQIHAHVKGYIQ